MSYAGGRTAGICSLGLVIIRSALYILNIYIKNRKIDEAWIETPSREKQGNIGIDSYI